MRLPFAPPVALAFTVSVLAAACHQGDGGPAAPPSSASPISASPSAASPSAHAATADAGPRSKAYATTPDERLGKLPPDLGVAVGQKAPDARATDLEGRSASLAELRDGRAILVAFYRGGWCPYCNFEIHELTKSYLEFERRGVTPVAISVDTPDEAAKTQRAYTLPFPVLSDPDLRVHEAFRVVHHADDAEVARLKGFGIELEKSSGRNHHAFAVPSLFLIDRDGIVRWAHVDPEYKVRPSIAQMLAAIDAAHLGVKP